MTPDDIANWQRITETVGTPFHTVPAGVLKDMLDMAARYAWLRDAALDFDSGPRESPWVVTGINHTDCHPIFGERLDAAIDDAMKEPKAT